MKVIFREAAKCSVRNIVFYIEEQGYPNRAEKYSRKLVDFGYSLVDFPDKYPICRFDQFAKKDFRCATFDRTYIFIYKIVKNHLIIYHIIHTKRLN
ncbi:MAG: type II toxin-antitoxin system RelE/ParE family toxin [Vicingaceae bacterium]|nr:type II toxin-antitoxin system RelE/ParE family toxin [Vicingaceae bacterium]